MARWVDTIQPGDVLRFRSGALRTVLDVSKRRDGRLHSAHFAIKVCSWTHRGYTILGRSDLLDRLEYRTLARIPLDRFQVPSRLVAEIERMRRARGPADFVPQVTCCDVVGVFE